MGGVLVIQKPWILHIWVLSSLRGKGLSQSPEFLSDHINSKPALYQPEMNPQSPFKGAQTPFKRAHRCQDLSQQMLAKLTAQQEAAEARSLVSRCSSPQHLKYLQSDQTLLAPEIFWYFWGPKRPHKHKDHTFWFQSLKSEGYQKS